MKTLVGRFAKDESGTAVLEYGVNAAAIGLAVAAIIGQIGGQLSTMFDIDTGPKGKAG